jgi:rhodanese-related sulfurtransferase/uncharacterized membrane protein YphA (DoxX/SURF4 family)
MRFKESFFKYLIPGVRILVGALFLVSGILKVIDITAFKNTLLALNLFSPLISQLLSYLVPTAEIILGLLLVLGIFIRFAAVHADVLILLFSWVTLYVVGYGRNLSYRYFRGFLNLPFNKFILAFLFMLFVLNVIVALEIKTTWSLERIIKEKLSKSKKIKPLELLIYILIVFGVLLITFSLMFNFGILGNAKTALPSQESGEGLAAENDVSSIIVTITVDEAYEAYNSGIDYIFLDVRSEDEYKSGHIKDAVHIPVSELEDRLNELSKDKPVIAYCNGSSCNRSQRAAQILVGNGFEEVYNMTGEGIIEWEEKGYPVEEADTEDITVEEIKAEATLISVDRVYEIISSNEDYVILDVRSQEEYDGGHLEGATLIPVDTLEGRLAELPEDKPIITYCKAGVRSANAAAILVENGFTQVYDMGGGTTEWIDKGYPTVSGE